MGLLRLPRRAPREEPPPPERLEVTDYRDFLLTAPHERLVSAHHAALAGLDPFVRAIIRNLAIERTGAGAEVLPEDTTALADLLVAGDADRRVAILDAYDDGVRHRLAHAVALVLQPSEDQSPEDQSPETPLPVIPATDARTAVPVLP